MKQKRNRVETAMYQTIQVSSCVSAQGELVEHLPNGDVVIRDGGTVYRGRPIAPVAAPFGITGSPSERVLPFRSEG